MNDSLGHELNIGDLVACASKGAIRIGKIHHFNRDSSASVMIKNYGSMQKKPYSSSKLVIIQDTGSPQYTNIIDEIDATLAMCDTKPLKISELTPGIVYDTIGNRHYIYLGKGTCSGTYSLSSHTTGYVFCELYTSTVTKTYRREVTRWGVVCQKSKSLHRVSQIQHPNILTDVMDELSKDTTLTIRLE